MKIITIYDSANDCLFQKAALISLNDEGSKEAKLIGDQLIETLLPKMPSAGLAAPQIGISKQVFIYSWNRELENLEVIVNPIITKFDQDTQISWEVCYSAIEVDGICKAALVARAKSIEVEYFDLDGNNNKKILEGFAAKVFQHEYDHLLGIVNTHIQNVEVKTFPNKEAMIEFIQTTKTSERVNYIKPIDNGKSL